ncbi:hypothetical protein IFM89_027093 [Coptis chinensis]|uniref:Uncharacterized protein n=1 Tax=Coptis chinensis TaxID=261450 RepID=A0A835HSG5_9MAGN|nr:hypothetical protein IFM89_027093 [Coptis chinensis]
MRRGNLCSTMKNMFNSSFGATFLIDLVESAFAYNIHQYADVYTSKPENFMLYPPEAWLHVPFDIKIMPHHVKMSTLVSPELHVISTEAWLHVPFDIKIMPHHVKPNPDLEHKISNIEISQTLYSQKRKHGNPVEKKRMEEEDEEEDYVSIKAKFHIIQELLGKLHATAASDQRSETCGSLLKEPNEERELVRPQ